MTPIHSVIIMESNNMENKPQIIFKKIINPWHLGKCSICKRYIWLWEKKVLVVAKFPNKIKIFFRCMKCQRKKDKKTLNLYA